MLKLAVRNLLRHRLRTAMTLAAIVFGVTALILSGGFIQDMYFKLAEALIHSQSGHVQVSRAGFYEKGMRSPEKFLIEEPEPIKQQLRLLPQVDDVLERVHFSGLLSNGRSDWPVIGEGVEPEREARLGTHIEIVEGRQLQESDAYGALVGQGVAEALALRPGDTVIVLATTADGALNTADLEVVGVVRSFSQDFDERIVRVPLEAAHALLGTDGANTIVVSLRRTADTALIADAMRRQLDPRRFEVKTWPELNEFYENTVALYERQFGVLQLIILVLVLLSVANGVNMSVLERVGEFGTMMALGNRSRTVFRLVVTEHALLGLAGGVLGVVSGLALAAAISAVGIPMPPPPNTNVGYIAQIRVLPSNVLAAFAIGVCATVLAAVFPARRVSRIPVPIALAQNY
jgi:putative ABC transport system permease protein